MPELLGKALPWFLALFAIAFVATFSLTYNYSAYSASFNYYWFSGFETEFGVRNLYPRRLSSLWLGTGGYDFLVYAPFPFWVAVTLAQLSLLSPSPEISISITAGLLFVASGVAFFFWARTMFERGPALAAAIAYMLMPYHLVIDWMSRQAFGEIAAYVFIPLCAKYMAQILRGQPGVVGLALSVSGLLLSHLPTALLAVHIFSVMFLVCLWLSRSQPGAIDRAVACIGTAMLGAALSSFYWLPAIFLYRDLSPEFLYGTLYQPQKNLIFAGVDQHETVTRQAVLLSLLAVIPVILGGLLVRRCRFDELGWWIVVSPVIVIVMNLPASAFIWENWIISRVQFPSRLLVFLDLAAALSVGVVLQKLWWREEPGVKRIAACLFPLALFYAFSGPSIYDIIRSGPLQAPAPSIEKYGAVEYLPPDLYSVLSERVLSDSQLTADNTNTEHYFAAFAAMKRENAGQWRADLVSAEGPRVLRLHTDGLSGPVVVPISYWKYWQAMSDTGQPVRLAPDKNGMMIVNIPVGAASVMLSMPWFESELAGFAISGAALIVLFTMGWRARRRGRVIDKVIVRQ